MVAIESTISPEFFKLGYALTRDGAEGRAFDQRHLVLHQDVEREAKTPTEKRVLAEGIRSVCRLPLIVHDQYLGFSACAA